MFSLTYVSCRMGKFYLPSQLRITGMKGVVRLNVGWAQEIKNFRTDPGDLRDFVQGGLLAMLVFAVLLVYR